MGCSHSRVVSVAHQGDLESRNEIGELLELLEQQRRQFDQSRLRADEERDSLKHEMEQKLHLLQGENERLAEELARFKDENAKFNETRSRSTNNLVNLNQYFWLCSELLDSVRLQVESASAHQPDIMQKALDMAPLHFFDCGGQHGGVLSVEAIAAHGSELGCSQRAINRILGMTDAHGQGQPTLDVDFVEFLFLLVSLAHEQAMGFSHSSALSVNVAARARKRNRGRRTRSFAEEHYCRLPDEDKFKIFSIVVAQGTPARFLKALEIFLMCRLSVAYDLLADVVVTANIDREQDPWWFTISSVLILLPALAKWGLFHKICLQRLQEFSLPMTIYSLLGLPGFLLIDLYFLLMYPWTNPSDAELLGTVERLSPIIDLCLETGGQAAFQLYMFIRLTQLGRKVHGNLSMILLASILPALIGMAWKLRCLYIDAVGMNMPLLQYLQELVNGPLGNSAPFVVLLTQRLKLSYRGLGYMTERQQQQIYSALGEDNRTLLEISFDDANNMKLDELAAKVKDNSTLQLLGLGHEYSLEEVESLFKKLDGTSFSGAVVFGDHEGGYSSVPLGPGDRRRWLDDANLERRSGQDDCVGAFSYCLAMSSDLRLSKHSKRERMLLDNVVNRLADTAWEPEDLEKICAFARRLGADESMVSEHAEQLESWKSERGSYAINAARKNFWLWGIWNQRVIRVPFLTQKVCGVIREVIIFPTAIVVLLEHGIVRAWGEGKCGELGLGTEKTSVPESTIVNFPRLGSDRIVDIKAGRHHVFALSARGKIFAWGDNQAGQLGLGDTQSRYEPCLLEELRESMVQILPAGNMSFALNSRREVYAWGDNRDGLLIVEYEGRRVLTPRRVLNLKEPIQWMEAQAAFTSSKDDSTRPHHLLLAFVNLPSQAEATDRDEEDESESLFRRRPSSYKNFYLWGILGKRAIKTPLLIQKVAGEVISVLVGNYCMTTLLADGTVQSWGEDSSCLGLGPETLTAPEPEEVTFPLLGSDRIIDIKRGTQHVLALSDSGKVYAWGNILAGQLGITDDHSGDHRCAPVFVEQLRNYMVIQIQALGSRSYALTSLGIVFAWGDNADGSIGVDSEATRLRTPEPMMKLQEVPVKKLKVADSILLGMIDVPRALHPKFIPGGPDFPIGREDGKNRQQLELSGSGMRVAESKIKKDVTVGDGQP